MQTQRQHAMCYRRGNRSPRRKPLRRPPSGNQSTRKYSWDTRTAIDPSIVGNRGIYTGVERNVKRQVFTKQGWLAA